MRFTIALRFTLVMTTCFQTMSVAAALPGDTVSWLRPDNTTFLSRAQRKALDMVKEVNNVDTNYIEPQQFNFTVMLQNTNTYEVYRLSTAEGQSVTFSPDMSMRLGPYFGWRWAFLGYTVDVKAHQGDHKKKEYDLSLYSSKIGVDLYYRETGNDYKIRRVNLGKDIDTSPIEGMPFGGLSSSIKGFNLYYILNHRRFSYPAAFSQSTKQLRSAGSPLVGIGYTRHKLSLNCTELNNAIFERMPELKPEAEIDSSFWFGTVKYTDISLSGGYAYNWVFARNWLMATSLSLAVAYKRSTGDVEKTRLSLRDFSFNNVNVDGIGRFGIVWNNSRWYAGMSAILHAYNYHKSRFYTNNFFGSINFYVGYNFIRRKKK